ncbi:hypothetical protein EAS56_07190 [Bradyrhizobium guangzhouense]|uniref:Uncharacterized protein n=1 Tax=Bradyrhizobium guangzhouense TaxID=1325095 RepID=A0AAE5X5S7_9BRAD|nr:hypothetical protein XH91_29625 [Bradyrhizobium guangzhouense]RXH15807.1 hypothetical protein EAS56_07190 [Bradyrhizobium guangzhouense]
MPIASSARERLARSDRISCRRAAVLVRPDGFVAWASDGAGDDEEAARAASRWFGEATTRRCP